MGCGCVQGGWGTLIFDVHREAWSHQQLLLQHASRQHALHHIGPVQGVHAVHSKDPSLVGIDTAFAI